MGATPTLAAPALDAELIADAGAPLESDPAYLRFALDRTDVEGRDADSQRACMPGLGVVGADRVSEDYSV